MLWRNEALDREWRQAKAPAASRWGGQGVSPGGDTFMLISGGGRGFQRGGAAVQSQEDRGVLGMEGGVASGPAGCWQVTWAPGEGEGFYSTSEDLGLWQDPHFKKIPLASLWRTDQKGIRGKAKRLKLMKSRKQSMKSMQGEIRTQAVAVWDGV